MAQDHSKHGLNRTWGTSTGNKIRFLFRNDLITFQATVRWHLTASVCLLESQCNNNGLRTNNKKRKKKQTKRNEIRRQLNYKIYLHNFKTTTFFGSCVHRAKHDPAIGFRQNSSFVWIAFSHCQIYGRSRQHSIHLNEKPIFSIVVVVVTNDVAHLLVAYPKQLVFSEEFWFSSLGVSSFCISTGLDFIFIRFWTGFVYAKGQKPIISILCAIQLNVKASTIAEPNTELRLICAHTHTVSAHGFRICFYGI